jgi:hypothetical protein
MIEETFLYSSMEADGIAERVENPRKVIKMSNSR